ncbi:MAG TPA: NAD(P)-dependent oxidoreductase [Burkholderiales bacterium]|nr:NAD(P)-dependent oxidoreductase [Burkholderiales bacterium]
MINRLLITGAAGKIGSSLRASLNTFYPVIRLSDIVPLTQERPNEEIDQTDLADFDAVQKMVEGVDAIVHLGGIGGVGREKEWRAVVDCNITGCFNVFEAARLAGVKRLVYTSSNHAVGFYPRTEQLDHTTYPRPDTRYGVSKVVGEALSSLYSFKHGLGVLCIRVGNFNPQPLVERHLSIWVSPRDLAQLVRIGLEHPDILFEVVYGVSGNTRSWWDNSNAHRLGYQPQDNAETYAPALADAPAAAKDDPVAELYQGGRHCSQN